MRKKRQKGGNLKIKIYLKDISTFLCDKWTSVGPDSNKLKFEH